MKFTEKEVKRDVRDLEFVIYALNVAENKGLYLSRLRTLISIIETNSVLNYLVYPYLELSVNLNKIEDHESDWFKGTNLNLPTNQDLEIAYVLQAAKRLSNGDSKYESFIVSLLDSSYGDKANMKVLKDWNDQLLMPVLWNIQHKLNDIVEDKVEGKEIINAKELKLLN